MPDNVGDSDFESKVGLPAVDLNAFEDVGICMEVKGSMQTCVYPGVKSEMKKGCLLLT
ncbi:MAG TPA: hypothetical protein VF008_16930 [Niastella sp.]